MDAAQSHPRAGHLTGAADSIPDEMTNHGVADRFDAIFNSAEIGVAKPDPRAFVHVCDHLAVSAGEVFFTDDSTSKLAGAIEIGMTARRYQGIERFRRHLDELLPPG